MRWAASRALRALISCGVEREEFFAGAAGIDVGLVGLRCLDLGLRAGGLAAQVGIIELQEQLALANMVAFFYEQMLHRGCNRRVGLEILDGFNFAVGGNQAADGAALHCGGANPQGSGPNENRDQSEGGNDDTDP